MYTINAVVSITENNGVYCTVRPQVTIFEDKMRENQIPSPYTLFTKSGITVISNHVAFWLPFLFRKPSFLEFQPFLTTHFIFRILITGPEQSGWNHVAGDSLNLLLLSYCFITACCSTIALSQHAALLLLHHSMLLSYCFITACSLKLSFIKRRRILSCFLEWNTQCTVSDNYKYTCISIKNKLLLLKSFLRLFYTSYLFYMPGVA